MIASQDVADIYPALERLAIRPPLIEHGGLVREAESGPKHLTTRCVGVCDTIRAAAARMPDRSQHAVEIPSMVDLAEFDPAARGPSRTALGVSDGTVLFGWAGRLDRKKRVEDFVRAVALVAARAPGRGSSSSAGRTRSCPTRRTSCIGWRTLRDCQAA